MSILAGIKQALKPTPILSVTEWSDRNRYLSSVSSAESGRWKTSRTPYLEEVGDNVGPHSPVIETIAVKGVQLGFTENGLNIAGLYMDIAPCPIMYVMPTIEMCKSLSKQRLTPMIENCPNLRDKIKSNRERDSGNTILEKSGPGFMFSMAGANSPAGLSSKPVRVIIFDEIDRYPLSAGDEGSPADLGIKRTSTFGAKRRIYKLSTPTMEKTSVIYKDYLETDQRKYFVPCPDCGHMQHLVFENLLCEVENDASTVYYKCQACEYKIQERHKTWMMARERAKWIPTCPEKIRITKRGYHINSLYSPIGWLSWAEIMQTWFDAHGDVNKLKTFVNTILGETWKDEGDCPPWENIRNRREKYGFNKPCKDVVFLTAGVDIQKDRIEVEVVGWCRRKISQSIDYRVIPGDTSGDEPFDKLSLMLNETWIREDGVELRIAHMGIDSGYNTSNVYTFSKKFDQNRVIPMKGNDGQQVILTAPKAVEVTKSGKKIGTVKVWHVGVSVLKSELYGFLKQEIKEDGVLPFGYCRFPEYGDEYFKGLTAEELQFKKNQRGYMVYQWVKVYERNEPLDCRNYARAAASFKGMDRLTDEQWDALDAANVAPAETEAPTKKRSSFWNPRN